MVFYGLKASRPKSSRPAGDMEVPGTNWGVTFEPDLEKICAFKIDAESRDDQLGALLNQKPALSSRMTDFLVLEAKDLRLKALRDELRQMPEHRHSIQRQNKRSWETTSTSSAEHPLGQLCVRYKYHEGHTNAVRRPLSIRDFI